MRNPEELMSSAAPGDSGALDDPASFTGRRSNRVVERSQSRYGSANGEKLAVQDLAGCRVSDYATNQEFSEN